MWEEWRKGVFILTIVQFVMRVAVTSIKPFIPLYLPEIGVTLPQQIAFWTGVATSANFIAQIITQPLWGSVADRYGYKIMIARSVFSVGFFNLALIWAASIHQLVFLRFLMGVMSGFTVASITFVAVTSPKEKLGYSVGLLQSGQMAGTILGPGVGGIFAQLFGYKGTFLFSGAIGLAMVPIIIFGIKYNPTANVETQSKKQFSLRDFAKVFQDVLHNIKTRSFISSIQLFIFIMSQLVDNLIIWRKKKNDKLIINNLSITILVIIACAQFGTQSSDSFIAIFVQQIYSGNKLNLVVALSFGLAAVATLLAAPIFGKIGDKYGHGPILHISMLGMALTVGLQTFCQDVTQLIVLRVLMGFFAAGIIPNAHAIIGAMAGESHKGRIFGIAGSATAVGNLTGPLIGGIIASTFNLRTVFLTTAVIIVAVEIFSVLYACIREEKDSGGT